MDKDKATAQYQRAISLVDYLPNDPHGRPYAVTFTTDGGQVTYTFTNLVAATFFIITEIFEEEVIR